MRIVKIARNKKATVKISKSDIKNIGKLAGWTKKSQYQMIDDSDDAGFINEDSVIDSATYEIENLDGMTTYDLEEYIRDCECHPMQREYAKCKLKAMRRREDGDIAKALQLEKDCDSIYRKIPEDLRW
jgi:hypothetical protein